MARRVGLLRLVAILILLASCGESESTELIAEVESADQTTCLWDKPASVVATSTISQGRGCTEPADDFSPASELHYDGPGGSTTLAGFDEHPVFLEVGQVVVLIVPSDASVTITPSAEIGAFAANLTAGPATLYAINRDECDPDCGVSVVLNELRSDNILPADQRKVIEIAPYAPG